MCPSVYFLSFIDHHNGFFIALFTLIIAIFTIFLWVDASSSSKKELRAYIHLEKMGMKVPIIVGEKPQVILEIKNFGTTPARDVSIWSKTKVLAKSSDPFIPIDATLESIGSIGPSATWNRCSYADESFIEGDLQKWGNKEIQVFIWGKIEYFDIFRAYP